MSLLHYNFLSRAAAKSMGVEPHEEWLCPWDLGSCRTGGTMGVISTGICVKMLRFVFLGCCFLKAFRNAFR